MRPMLPYVRVVQHASPRPRSLPADAAALHRAAISPSPGRSLQRKDALDRSYLSFCDMFTRALISQDPFARRRVLEHYNDCISPMLHTEEAALQLLITRLVHLKLNIGWHVRLHVQRSLSGTSVSHLARDYRIHDIFSHPKGGVGVIIEPTDASGNHASIMLFRGTASCSGRGRDILADATYPSGGLDDIHHLGVGHVGTRNLSTWFHGHVNRVQGAGRRLVLVGHSLGGAYALKLLASLKPEAQQNVHTLVFCPPGITWREARAVVSPPQNTRIIFHRWDPVSLAGVAFPPGMMATIHDTISRGPTSIPHGSPQLAIREARGEAPDKSISRYTEKRRHGFNFSSIVAEPVRILGGRIIRHMLRD